MIKSIRNIPQIAAQLYEKHKDIKLPQRIFYLANGYAFNAVNVLKYCGKQIYPEDPAQFKYYYQSYEKLSLGIFLPVNGKTEIFNHCLDSFHEFVIISKHTPDLFHNRNNSLQSIDISIAGNHYDFDSSNYLYLLLILYQGLGTDCYQAIDYMRKDIDYYEVKGQILADKIQWHIQNNNNPFIYIVGDGPNLFTARQAAEILYESTGYPFLPVNIEEFYHKNKHNRQGGLVIVFYDHGPGKLKIERLRDIYADYKDSFIYIEEMDLQWNLSPLNLLYPIVFASYILEKRYRSRKQEISPRH